MEKIYYTYENGLGALTTSDLQKFYDADDDNKDYTLDGWIGRLIADCLLKDIETFYSTEITSTFLGVALVVDALDNDEIDIDELRNDLRYGKDLYHLCIMSKNEYGIYTDAEIRDAVNEFNRKYN